MNDLMAYLEGMGFEEMETAYGMDYTMFTYDGDNLVVVGVGSNGNNEVCYSGRHELSGTTDDVIDFLEELMG